MIPVMCLTPCSPNEDEAQVLWQNARRNCRLVFVKNDIRNLRGKVSAASFKTLPNSRKRRGFRPGLLSVITATATCTFNFKPPELGRVLEERMNVKSHRMVNDAVIRFGRFQAEHGVEQVPAFRTHERSGRV